MFSMFHIIVLFHNEKIRIPELNRAKLPTRRDKKGRCTALNAFTFLLNSNKNCFLFLHIRNALF